MPVGIDEANHHRDQRSDAARIGQKVTKIHGHPGDGPRQRWGYRVGWLHSSQNSQVCKMEWFQVPGMLGGDQQ